MCFVGLVKVKYGGWCDACKVESIGDLAPWWMREESIKQKAHVPCTIFVPLSLLCL